MCIPVSYWNVGTYCNQFCGLFSGFVEVLSSWLIVSCMIKWFPVMVDFDLLLFIFVCLSLVFDLWLPRGFKSTFIFVTSNIKVLIDGPMIRMIGNRKRKYTSKKNIPVFLPCSI